MVSTNGLESSWKDKFEKRYSQTEIKMMSGIQKDRAIKEILDETMAQKGEKVYKGEKKLSKEDKEISNGMSAVVGGGKTSEVESSVTEKPSKEIAKGKSKLKNEDEDEEEEDHHEEEGHHEKGGEAPK